MQAVPPSLPQTHEILFQLSLLNIASAGESARQAQELEKLLLEQTAQNKH